MYIYKHVCIYIYICVWQWFHVKILSEQSEGRRSHEMWAQDNTRVGAAMKLESLLLATFLQLVQVGIKSGIQKVGVSSSGEPNQIETSTVVSCHCDCHCSPKLLPFDLSALELGIGLISLVCLISPSPFERKVPCR